MDPESSDVGEILGIDNQPVSVPEAEEEWRRARVTCGLNTPPSIIGKVFSLESWEQIIGLQRWQRTVVIAANIVDISVGQVEEDDVTELGKIYSRPPGYDTRRRDRATILSLINLFDRLYAGLEHRASELLVIWNTPLSNLRLWTSKKYQDLYSHFSHIILGRREEIQTAIPLYMPFLVHLVRLQYILKQIGRALNTTLSQFDFETFQRTIVSQELNACPLHTLGSFRTPHHELTTIVSPLPPPCQTHSSRVEVRPM
ncbi:hypothetical protein FSARC_14251 [Fusarium sarcochroum]|uniref:Uncharacterized protein n=1 Tax=Fusarium sarcochroum TaxID=1208366 RepID=A0A8H4SV22_9HYPO|nr:hypothetical protein FSARC_14251 [Fusarium sarcochroum]